MAQKADSQTSSDLKAVLECVAKRLPIDPSVRTRIQRRASEIRQRLEAEGPRDLAVPLIREIRDA